MVMREVYIVCEAEGCHGGKDSKRAKQFLGEYHSKRLIPVTKLRTVAREKYGWSTRLNNAVLCPDLCPKCRKKEEEENDD